MLRKLHCQVPPQNRDKAAEFSMKSCAKFQGNKGNKQKKKRLAFHLIRNTCFSSLPGASMNYVAVRDDVGLKNTAFQLLKLLISCLCLENVF